MNIRTVRNKIKSVGNVKKITKAMQLVSAVKMKKAVNAALEGRPYQEILEEMIARLGKKIDPSLSPLLHEQGDSQNAELIILISTNKGLCGAFNGNLFRYLMNEKQLKSCDAIVIGKKGAQFAARTTRAVTADFSQEYPDSIVSAVIGLALAGFLEGKYKKVFVAYNRFISTFRTEPTIETLLPVAPNIQDLKDENKSQYIVEPAPEVLIGELLRSYIEEKLRYVLIQTEAGEHATRMVAMKNATDNANDLIYNLTLERNKLRQQKITYELLDMITAKESVESN